MKLPLSWVYDYTDIGEVSPKEFSDALTLSGSKVEGFERMGEEIQNVQVGKILKKEKHPNADTLWVCQVDFGDEQTQIVTGAQNINEGDLVPCARHGAKLPGGITIKSGKLRGEVSNGMMCSHEELGLALDDIEGACEDGILILQKDYPLGTDIKDVIGLNESVIEFEITSNRPDCLSVIGLAREAAATYGTPFKVPEPKETGNGENVSDYVKVTVQDPDLCPRYVARAVKNIKIAPSPKWMRDRLTAAGVRPINNIVDITNYVMLEYGQPMHAFDRKYLKGNEINVRRAKDGEILKTLDGEDRKLDSSMLVIADAENPSAVAGVMGGEHSEIQDDTKEMIFESAMFFGPSVRLTAKALGMRTESSARFEKGLDTENCLCAINRACELVEELGAGEVIGGVIDIYPEKKKARILPLEVEKTNVFLGTDISKADMVKTLRLLQFEVDENKNEIVVPTFRDDVESFADVAEEIARIYGYDKIESTPMRGSVTIGGRSAEKQLEEKICNTLCDLGFYETMTYAFTHPASLAKINRGDELQNCIKIANPLGEENSVMRNNLVHSTLEILALNYKQRNKNARIFEIGKIYVPHALPLEELPDEIKYISVGAYGNCDFFEIKGAIEELFDSIGVKDYSFEADETEKAFHPGKTAAIYIGKEKAGYIGEIHPDVAERYEIEEDVYIAEIKLETVIKNVAPEKKYKTLNRFPSVTRDIALLVDTSVPAAKVLEAIKKYAGKSLESIELFDVYQGKQIPEGKKSMAYSATFRAEGRTMNESDMTKIMDKLIKMLQKDLGAELR
ncbi:MAG: phenylalanine--tRNA ligase subunit beta [Clostridia bacterium]|nr:phenylalanine--tRNA ligase subunit beta [Clostridia bacterium]